MMRTHNLQFKMHTLVSKNEPQNRKNLREYWQIKDKTKGRKFRERKRRKHEHGYQSRNKP